MKRIYLSNLIKSNNIFRDIFTKQSERTDKTDNYYVYYASVTGIHKLGDYCDFLANIRDRASKYKAQYLMFDKEIPFSPDSERLDNILTQLSNINPDNIQNSSIKLPGDAESNERLKNGFSVIYKIAKNNNLFKTSDDEKDFLTKIIIWIQDNLKDIIWRLDDNPKVFYFGEAEKHEALFLFLLAAAGFDTVYMNPCGNSFDNSDLDLPVQNFVYEIKTPEEEFTFDSLADQGKVINKITSPAKAASEELKEKLFTPESGIFRPFQFAGGKTDPLLINGTLDDLEVYFHQPAKMRPGFHIYNENTVIIPNFFFKINGVNADHAKYFSLIADLRKNKNTLFACTINIVPVSIDNSRINSLDSAVDKNNRLIKKILRSNPLYRLKNIRFELEEFILSKIEETISSPIFKFTLERKEILHLVASVISMDSKVLAALENFDFTQSIPKVVIYTNQLENMNIESVFLFAFMNRAGFDIVIFNTAGGSSIENFLDPGFFNTIVLEEFSRNLPLKTEVKKTSILKKIFSI